ncbi:hypothetical protein LTR50_005209 [Elasticomyces elasticus]|nr:hypothetical protein LTR50_005209 [Elasticomyces elasticus]
MQSLPGDRRIETYNPAINEILKHMNATRRLEGKAPLQLHAGLCGLAQDWANEMEQANQVSYAELGHLLKVSSDPHTTSESALTKHPKKCGSEINQDDEDAIQVIGKSSDTNNSSTNPSNNPRKWEPNQKTARANTEHPNLNPNAVPRAHLRRHSTHSLLGGSSSSSSSRRGSRPDPRKPSTGTAVGFARAGQNITGPGFGALAAEQKWLSDKYRPSGERGHYENLVDEWEWVGLGVSRDGRWVANFIG